MITAGTYSTWTSELDTARRTVRNVARAIIPEFGKRAIITPKGLHDIQLRADLVAREIISSHLRTEYPGYGLVTEEDRNPRWLQSHNLWVVDPLDGTNNFGYGIAHCAVALTLFSVDRAVLAVVYDPILKREFYATETQHSLFPEPTIVPLSRATVSVVTNYTEEGRLRGQDISSRIGDLSKRVLSLWSPALDLALIASGQLDGMVCHGGSLLDLCGGIYLVQAAGGCVIDMSGEPLTIHRAMHKRPISFIAAGSRDLAIELLRAL